MPRGWLRALNPRKCQSIFRISGREAKSSSPQHPNKASNEPPECIYRASPGFYNQIKIVTRDGYWFA